MPVIFTLSGKKKMWLRLDKISPYMILLTLFISAAAFRPLLPVDETRYMTVAWEMYLKKEYFLPTLNFEPYHHKPPMLFWLINAAWHVFGVSRSAGLLPVFGAASAVMMLTKKLAQDIFPGREALENLIPWLMLGSFPFLIYGTLVMFDIMVTAIVLATLLVFRDHARNPRWYKIFFTGMLMAMGVLTKGPVVFIYILSPLLLYFWWKNGAEKVSNRSYYLSLAVSLLLSIFPVIAWLGMAISKADSNFAFWLLWEQTAGRITGNFSAAHVRPFYFYFQLLPLLFVPWAFFPTFLTSIGKNLFLNTPNKFLLSAFLPAFVCFLSISGKQAHYILPLLPYIIIFTASIWTADFARSVRITTIILACTVIFAQFIASNTEFKKYDITPFADFYAQNRDYDWAFVRNYQGQIGFLGKVEKPIEKVGKQNVRDWLKHHPHGYMIIRYDPLKENMDEYKVVMERKYRSKMLSIIQEK